MKIHVVRGGRVIVEPETEAKAQVDKLEKEKKIIIKMMGDSISFMKRNFC